MEIYDSAGVDLTAIRYMLSLSISERVAMFEDFIDFALQTWELNGIRPSFLGMPPR